MLTESMPLAKGARVQCGFTLVEMMIAIVAGLVLISAATALVVSILMSNADSLGTTRLTQELRAITQVMSKEIRRAGSRANSLEVVAAGALPSGALTNVTITTSSCIQFAYQTADNAGTTTTKAVTIALVDGQVLSGSSADAATPVDCDEVDVVLSSPQIQISALSFVPIPSATKVQGVAMYVEGSLLSGSAGARAVIRHYTESVYIPSLVAL